MLNWFFSFFGAEICIIVTIPFISEPLSVGRPDPVHDDVRYPENTKKTILTQKKIYLKNSTLKLKNPLKS